MSKLAILGGEPTRTKPYPEWPVHDERDIEAVTRVIKSGNWGGYPYPGPETRKFLQKFVELQGGGYPVAMANGTVTMEVALRASGIGWGDEVIVPAITFQATAAAPLAAGAIPVIVDVDPETYTLDPQATRAAITPKTKAIIPVHLAAQMADMDAIMALAEEFDLVVIEDCAHAHGAKWRGRGAGTIGHFGSFSLQSSKILTSGEGGVLLCRTPELAAKAAGIINCGRSHDPATMKESGDNYVMGANYRMSELACAIAAVGLVRFPEQARQREAMLGYMEESLSEIHGVRLLRRDERHTTRSFYQFNFAIVPQVFGAEHKEVAWALNAEGIPCDTGYEAMNNYTLFQPQLSKLPVPSAFPEYFDFEQIKVPEATRACEHEALTVGESVFRAGPEGIDDFVAALKKVQENATELRAAAEKWRAEHGKS
jgi:L-glutamine:2-deoxy-scyllo-inosose/3-amino-2,3-dideoxy-scyllo-inosose aminotransferase